jgi:cytochrome c biogenesis factor
MGTTAPLLDVRTRREPFFASARGAILRQFALVTLASFSLIYVLVTTDFSSRSTHHGLR